MKGVFGDCQFTCFPDCQLALPPDSAKNPFFFGCFWGEGWFIRGDWRVTLPFGFALLGESLLAVAPKGTKRSCPSIRPRLRRGSFAPSLLQGPACKDHPWPFKPLAASMRLAPLRSDCAHPPERGGWCCLSVHSKTTKKTEYSQGFGRPGGSVPVSSVRYVRCCGIFF